MALGKGYRDPEAEKLDKQVKGLMALGYAPSQIDEKLKLDSGMAHDVVVRLWSVSPTGAI